MSVLIFNFSVSLISSWFLISVLALISISHSNSIQYLSDSVPSDDKFNVFLETMAKIGVATNAVDPEKTRDFTVQWRINILFSIARATAKYAAQAAFWHNAVTSV